MKFLPLLIVAGVTLLGGCASDFSNPRIATAANTGEESYVPLGSAIPKKTAKRTEDQTVDLQQLENARTMGNANMNGAPVGR